MSRNQFIVYSTCLMVLTFMNGCAKTREAFGLNRHQPDEFTTPSRPRLDRPKNSSLVLPKQGASSRGYVKTDKQALEIVAGKTPSTDTCDDISAVEHDLMKATKADQVLPHIRDKIDHETVHDTHTESAIRKMLFWNNKKHAGEIIDPVKEYAELQKQNEKSE